MGGMNYKQFKRPTWRSDTYHVKWESISLIHCDKEAFDTLSESVNGFLG